LTVTMPAFCMIDNFTLDAESRRTHPAGLHRLVTFLKAMEKTTYDREIQETLRKSGYLDQWVQGITDMREWVKNQGVEVD